MLKEQIVIENGIEIDCTEDEIKSAEWELKIYHCDDCSCEQGRDVFHVAPDQTFKGVSG